MFNSEHLLPFPVGPLGLLPFLGICSSSGLHPCSLHIDLCLTGFFFFPPFLLGLWFPATWKLKAQLFYFPCYNSLKRQCQLVEKDSSPNAPSTFCSFFLVSGALWLIKAQFTMQTFFGWGGRGSVFVFPVGLIEPFLKSRRTLVHFLLACLYHIQALLFGDPFPEPAYNASPMMLQPGNPLSLGSQLGLTNGIAPASSGAWAGSSDGAGVLPL